jgi:hydrogenase maturation protease
VPECAPELVLAVGNRFRRDDGVAPAVLDELRRRDDLAGGGSDTSVELVELDGEPARLVDAWEGRRCVVLLDAIHDPDRAPGEVVVIDDTDDLGRWDCGWSSHSGGVSEALRLGEVLARLPDRVVVVGVVVGDVGDGPGLSGPVRAAVASAADAAGAALAAVRRTDDELGEVRRVPR